MSLFDGEQGEGGGGFTVDGKPVRDDWLEGLLLAAQVPQPSFFFC